jgi:hypothetical protein
VQAGILDLPTGGPVGDAIRADAELTERQKQVLLDVYESFRRENAAARPAAESPVVNTVDTTDTTDNAPAADTKESA